MLAVFLNIGNQETYTDSGLFCIKKWKMNWVRYIMFVGSILPLGVLWTALL
jgi:hypothetical protein